MSSFIQVNHGIAFANGEVLGPDDADALRTNGNLSWLANLRGLVSADLEMATIVGSSGSQGFGPSSWSDYLGSYISIGGKPLTSHWLASASPGGPVSVSQMTVTGLSIDVVTRPASICSVHNAAMAYPDYFILAYYDYSANKTSVACGFLNDNIVMQPPVYSGASALTFNGTMARASGVHVGAYPFATYLIPGSATAQSAFLRVVGAYQTSNLVDCTAQVHAGTHSGGEVTSMAVNTAKTRAVGICSSAAYVLAFDTSSNTATEYAAPIHVSAATDLGFRRIAFDPQSNAFIVMTIGNPSNPATSSRIYWTSSSDGSTWSSTVGWKAAFFGLGPSSGAVPSTFVLNDFTITNDGIWLVLISSNYNRYRMYASNDSGANWYGVGGWMRYSDQVACFSREGPSVCLTESMSSTRRIISVGGASHDMAAILSSPV